MKLRKLSSAVVVATTALLLAEGPQADPLGDADNDGIANGADLDADNDGIPDLIEIGAESIAAPQTADGTADDTVPLRQWKVELYRGHYAVQNAPAPANLNSIRFGEQGDPVLSEEAYLALDSTLMSYSDNDIPITDNPFDSLQAESRADIVSGGLDTDAADGTWQMIFTRKINAAGVITIGEAGAWFDDYAELFVNGTLVDSIIGFYSSLPASEIITHPLNAGDTVEIRLTNRGGPGGFTMNGDFPAMDIDADDDSIPNHLDLDSDNDGIADAIERLGPEAAAVDIDGNGTIDGDEFIDADGDGLADAFDADPADPSNATSIQDTAPDTDGDGLQDWRDTDSDDDGLPDTIEQLVDTDADGSADYRDTDSDNDGIADAQEAVLQDANLAALNGSFVDNETLIERTASVECGPGHVASEASQIAFDLGWNNGPQQNTDVSTLSVSSGDTLYLTITTPSGGDSNTDNATQNGGDAVVQAQNGASFVNLAASGQGASYIDHTPFQDWNYGELHVSTPDAVESVALSGQMGFDDFGVRNVRVPDGCLNDTDGDGIANHRDVDSDDDGIPDAIEGDVDTDQDTFADYLDIDSDNDGIADNTEAAPSGADQDGDGIDDLYDVDQTAGADLDADGVDDALEASDTLDTDGDGIPNAEDVDSDGDTIPDAIEGVVDTDSDGTANYLDLDSDDDGIDDAREAQSSGVDSDDDGIDDSYDVDSVGGADLDSDGVSDALEASGTIDTDGDGTADALDLDSDNDSLPDATEGVIDTDGDGRANYLELDSDDDGISDATEAGDDPLDPRDSDADGTPDYRDIDSDDDGISDALENGTDPNTQIDSDSDGLPDYLDLDSDDDGTPDAVEAGSDGSAPIDADNNGVPDFRDPAVAPLDSDGDGIVDLLESTDDTDADGLADYLDIDSDNDGLLDADEVGNIHAPIDSDDDGVVDYLDLDSDNDGLTDALEAGVSDADGDGIVDGFTDANADGHDDAVGANPPGIADFDTDGIANYLDVDSDNDGLTDLLESGGASLDVDGDGRIDRMDDVDGNGLADGLDGTPSLDTDNDGAPNYHDLDSDNDGIYDLAEVGGSDVDDDGRVDAWADDDADGVPDSIDVDFTGGDDVDGDGIDDIADADFVADTDTDGDGIIDAFDDDASGSGFSPIDPNQPLSAGDLPDEDGDGTPDVLQFSPEGIIRTGISGGAAAFGSGVVLALMAGVAGIARRRRRND
jgi:hypothetical protein